MPKDTCLTRASAHVDGEDGRGSHYGHPYDHFARTIGQINALFTEVVRARLEAGEPMFYPEDWGHMMVCDKQSREMGLKKVIDNLDDGCGYFRTIEKLREREAELLAAEGARVNEFLGAFSAGMAGEEQPSNGEGIWGPATIPTPEISSEAMSMGFVRYGKPIEFTTEFIRPKGDSPEEPDLPPTAQDDVVVYEPLAPELEAELEARGGKDGHQG